MYIENVFGIQKTGKETEGKRTHGSWGTEWKEGKTSGKCAEQKFKAGSEGQVGPGLKSLKCLKGLYSEMYNVN